MPKTVGSEKTSNQESSEVTVPAQQSKGRAFEVAAQWQGPQLEIAVGQCGISLTAGSVPGRMPSQLQIDAGLEKNPEDGWEQDTQLRFGTVYKITDISADKSWIN